MKTTQKNPLVVSDLTEATDVGMIKAGAIYMDLGDFPGERTSTSNHTGGVHFLLGDGSVRSIS